MSELDDFEGFCSELTLENGRKMVLEPFQARMLQDYFSGATETLILVGKKNGKSSLLAALALYHLLVTPNAECVIAAASRDQAQIMLRQARGFIRRNEDLAMFMEVKQREITSKRDDGRIRVLAADADTADGVIPTLALVDELHRHRTADLYGVFRDGLGPRQGRMITISTAGDDEDSALGRMRTKARALPLVQRESGSAYTYARSSDGSYVMHEWALDASADRDDMSVVKLANPASWQTIEALRQRHESPSMTPWQWARFACGVWLQGEDTAIDPLEWAACAHHGDMDPDGAVQIGMDVALKWDTTALVVHWLDSDGVAWIPEVRVLKPDRQGKSLAKRDILRAANELRARWGAETVVLDPEAGGMVIAEDLEDLGFETVAHSQKPQPMAMAAERFSAAISERKLRHPADPVFTRHALNAHVQTTQDGKWKFVKESKQSSKHIDALIAAAMVHSVAVAEGAGPTPFVFEVLS